MSSSTGKRRPSTVRDYRRELEKRLIPEFGEDTPLIEITTGGIEEFRERHGASRASSARARSTSGWQQLHAIFKRAQRVFGLCSSIRSPAQSASPSGALATSRRSSRPRGRAARRAVPSNDQDAAIFPSPLSPACGLESCGGCAGATSTGCGRSSSCGGHIPADADGPTEVGQGALRPAGRSGCPGAGQAEQAGALDRRTRTWCSSTTSASHIEDSALRRRFYRRSSRPGSPRIRFHDLRHTFGTIAVQAFPLTDVKAFMGHADIQTTMIYVHHVPQHDAADSSHGSSKTALRVRSGCTAGARSEAESQDRGRRNR